MDEDRTKDDPMDITDQSEGAPRPHNTRRANYPYSSPPLREDERERRKRGEDDPDSEEEDHETEEAKAARRKAKGKAKASSFPEDQHESDYRREDTDTDMDAYWAHEAHLAHENAAGKESPNEGYFGDADAYMNDTLSSSSSAASYDSDKENTNTPPGAPNNSPNRREVGGVDVTGLKRKLEDVQQQQRGGEDSRGRGRGRGRGSGAGKGWGWQWQESMTQGSAARAGRVAYDSRPSSPSLPTVAEEAGWEWEKYDYTAWEKAAQEVGEKQRTGVVSLKVPQSTFSAKPVSVQGSTKRPIDPKIDPASQRPELVMAVKDYRAIISGNYLSYKKGDVLRVIHRVPGGSYLYIS